MTGNRLLPWKIIRISGIPWRDSSEVDGGKTFQSLEDVEAREIEHNAEILHPAADWADELTAKAGE